MIDACCRVRRYMKLGIEGVDETMSVPVEVADFVDWQASARLKKTVIRIRFCPFCGQDVRDQELMLKV